MELQTTAPRPDWKADKKARQSLIKRLRAYANTKQGKTKPSPADIALSISMRGNVRVSYLQVYRWLDKEKPSFPHPTNANELHDFLTEQGF